MRRCLRRAANAPELSDIDMVSQLPCTAKLSIYYLNLPRATVAFDPCFSTCFLSALPLWCCTAQAYANSVEVSVAVNEDRRFYTIKFLLPDGNEHTVITRYSALMAFYRVRNLAVTIRLRNCFSIPPPPSLNATSLTHSRPHCAVVADTGCYPEKEHRA